MSATTAAMQEASAAEHVLDGAWQIRLPGGLTLGTQDAAGIQWHIADVKGWDERDSTGTHQPRQYADGSWLNRAYVPARIVVVEGDFIAMEYSSKEEQGSLLGEAAHRLLESIPLRVAEPVQVTRTGEMLTAEMRQDGPQIVKVNRQGTMGRFSLQMVAPDPLRYGPEVTTVTGFAMDRSALEFDLFTDGAGADTGYLEFSAPGDETGVLTMSNTGNVATMPVFNVVGPVGDAGFQLVADGRVVQFSRGVAAGSTLVLDAATGRATLDGADQSLYLTLREWTPVPPYGQLDVVFLPLGGATAGQLYATTRSAWW